MKKMKVMMLKPHKKLDRLCEYSLSRSYAMSLIRKGYAVRSNASLKREVESHRVNVLARGKKALETPLRPSESTNKTEVSEELFDPSESTKAEISEFLHEHRVDHSMRQRKDELVTLVQELYNEVNEDGEV